VSLLGGALLSCACEAFGTGGAARADEASAAPRAMVDEYLKLVTAPPVGVDAMQKAAVAELPYARVRLFVRAFLTGPTLQGIDSRAFRATGHVSRIEMPLPSDSFRDIVDQTLRASSPCSRLPCDAEIRTIDVWCKNTGAPGVYQPLLVKVWDDRPLDEPTAERATRKIRGRLCHADVPFVAACQAAFDFQPTVVEDRMLELTTAPGTAEIMAMAVSSHRESVVTASRQAESAGGVRTVPIPGGVRIELTGIGDLPSAMCRHEGTVHRTEAGETFVGLADGVSKGTCLFSVEAPFPVGAAAIRATAETLDASSSVEIEASTGSGRWTTLLRIGDRPTRTVDRWALPIAGPRALGRRLDVPITHTLVETEGVLQVVELPQPLSYASARRPHLQLILQRDRITPAEIVTMVHEDRSGTLDVYAPCDLNDAACNAIANYAGTIRFWAQSPWQEPPPECLGLIISGTGSITFPRLQHITAPLAKLLGGGRKSLAFPEVKDAEPAVLKMLAGCSGELSLDGFKQLSQNQSEALASYRGPLLSLAAARQIRCAGPAPEPFLRAAVATPGTLALDGLEDLDVSTAAILASGRKQLLINDIVALSPEVAAVLASSREGVSLNGLASLDRESVRALLAYDGAFLSLGGLQRVECRLDDLRKAATPPGRPPRLASLLQPKPTTATLEGKTLADALLQSPGTLQVGPDEDGGAQTTLLDATTASLLAKGLKDLDLDGFSTLTPEVFKTFCQSQRMISLGGLTAIPDGCLPDLCTYAGPMLFLDGVRDLSQDQITALLDIITSDRISLTGAGIYNIGKLRTFADTLRGNAKQLKQLGDLVKQQDLEEFRDRTNGDEWPQIGRVKVLLMSREAVVFRDLGRKENVTRDRDQVSNSIQNKLDELAKCADKIAAARKAVRLTQPPDRGQPAPP
jgi:hypothetical protein